MATQASIVGKKLISYFESLERTRLKVETAFINGHVNKKDVEKIYDGLYLNAIGSFENFIEELFFGLLSKRLSVSKTIRPRVIFTSLQATRKVLLGTKEYLKWLPYKMTEDMAEIYFFGDTPFSSLEKKEIDDLQKMIWVRNAVAHKSPYAIKKFEDKVIGGLILPPSEKNPSGFLRGYFRVSPSQTRYEDFINSIAQIVIKISK